MNKSKLPKTRQYNKRREETANVDDVAREEMEFENSYYDYEYDDEMLELRERNIRKRLSQLNRFSFDEIEEKY